MNLSLKVYKCPNIEIKMLLFFKFKHQLIERKNTNRISVKSVAQYPNVSFNSDS